MNQFSGLAAAIQAKMSTTRSNIRVIPLAGKFDNIIFGKPKQIGTSGIYLQSIWDTKTKTGFITILKTDENGEFYPPEKKDIQQIIGPKVLSFDLEMVSY